jgi:hypothetical protein
LVALGLLAESAGVVRQALLDVGLGLQAHLHQALDVLLDHFVDALARRIARFDKQSIAEIKRRVEPSLPFVRLQVR